MTWKIDTKRALRCNFCDLVHDKVEAGGLWYCPNPICPGCGAAYHRRKMDSYQEIENGRHTVDPKEKIAIGERLLEQLDLDPNLWEAIERCVIYYKGGPKPHVPKGGSERFNDLGRELAREVQEEIRQEEVARQREAFARSELGGNGRRGLKRRVDERKDADR